MPIKIIPDSLFNTMPTFRFPLSFFVKYEEKYATNKHHNKPVNVKVRPKIRKGIGPETFVSMN